MKTINRDIVGAFIFSSDGKVLLGKNKVDKNKTGGAYQGLWTIPGGGVEEGESIFDATKREVFEEVGVDISGSDIEPLEAKYGESTKMINGEVVLVKMNFRDHKVHMTSNSADIKTFKVGDGFESVTWVAVDDLKSLELAAPTKTTLSALGYI